ncbi:MAG: radical SAM protein [Magnetococcales bacterium]|nr:radical SAM protein [Magnetococcales bacterium]
MFTTLCSLSYQIVKSNVKRSRAPIFLSLYITNRCNLKCKYCFVVDPSYSKEFLRSQLSFDEIREIIDTLYDQGMRMVFMLGGEPLVHRDFDRIVRYIVEKGVYLQVVSNGLLIHKRLETLRLIHGLCVSIDGPDDVTDFVRGQGVYVAAMEGIRLAVKNGIPTRIHAVLTRQNIGQIRVLAETCQQLGIEMTISPPNFLGETDDDYMRISTEEYKTFWSGYLELQKEGLPIVNSPVAIRKCQEWPVDYHRYIRRDEHFPDYKPVFCMNGYTYVAIGADGTMYNCINLGPTNGPNIREHGILGAWERLLDYRPDCVSCSSINCIETALLLKMRLSILREGLRFHKNLFSSLRRTGTT